MEHYFDAAKVLSLAESTKNQTADFEVKNFGKNFENLDIPGTIPDSTWPISNGDSYDHERYMQLVMLFLVLFFLVRKLSKICPNWTVLIVQNGRS